MRALQLDPAPSLLGCKLMNGRIERMRIMPCQCLFGILKLAYPPSLALLLTVTTQPLSRPIVPSVLHPENPKTPKAPLRHTKTGNAYLLGQCHMLRTQCPHILKAYSGFRALPRTGQSGLRLAREDLLRYLCKDIINMLWANRRGGDSKRLLHTRTKALNFQWVLLCSLSHTIPINLWCLVLRCSG